MSVTVRSRLGAECVACASGAKEAYLTEYAVAEALVKKVNFWSGIYHKVAFFSFPNWPTVAAAFAVAFLSWLVASAILAGISIHLTGSMPWDRIKRQAPRRQFCLYLYQQISMAIACGLIGVEIVVLPILPIIAAGLAPRLALKGLSGGTLEIGEPTGDETSDASTI
jgi:hypothetical protein